MSYTRSQHTGHKYRYIYHWLVRTAVDHDLSDPAYLSKLVDEYNNIYH